MNALMDLASEVKFRERMRGYDYEEVDSYVKKVSRAAAQANERIAELEHRLAQLESHAGKDEGVTEIRETLLRTLVLAQRTADSAVAEARSEAKSITDSAKERATKTVSEAETAANERLRSAEERAARMLAESEENGQLILAEAKRTAAAELSTERERAQGELQDLEMSKSELEAVVTEIEARLDSERDMLRSLALSFQSFAEKFEPVAVIAELADEAEDGERAAGVDAEADAGDTAAEGDPAVQGAPAGNDDADPEPSGAPNLEFLPASEDAGQESEGAPEEALPTDAVDTGAVPDVPVVEWDEEIGQDPSDDVVHAAEPEPVAPEAVPLEPSAGGNGSGQPEQEVAPRDEEAAFAGPATMPFGVDSPELFDMDAEEDDEFIEQLRQVVSSDAPLPEGDAAMAAFFDHDAGAPTRSGASGRGGRLGPRA